MSTFTWLHLSDLHYCEPNNSWDAEDILSKLVDDLIQNDRNECYGLFISASQTRTH